MSLKKLVGWLDCGWRLVGTALSFSLFGVIGILLGLLFFPLTRLLPLGPALRRELGCRIVCACFRGFIGFMRLVGVLTYDFRAVERLGREGQLILANHPSLIDVVFLVGFTRRAGCVVKAALWKNPFTGGVVASAGYVPNSPTVLMVEGAAAVLEQGYPVIMFPEGTRSTPGAPLDFHRGAASVAVRAAKVITPVFIRVNPTTLTKGEPWYRIPARRPHFALVVGDDIDPAQFAEASALPKAARALNAHLLEVFSVALEGGLAPPPAPAMSRETGIIRDSFSGNTG